MGACHSIYLWSDRTEQKNIINVDAIREGHFLKVMHQIKGVCNFPIWDTFYGFDFDQIINHLNYNNSMISGSPHLSLCSGIYMFSYLIINLHTFISQNSSSQAVAAIFVLLMPDRLGTAPSQFALAAASHENSTDKEFTFNI